jgi:ketosteroid isomerase-like protein
VQTTQPHRNLMVFSAVILLVGACAGRSGPQSTRADRESAAAVERVRATEVAFAKTMADRDFSGFVAHLSREAVFFGEGAVKHGSAEVAAAWKPLFGARDAPFSWAPDHIEVLSSGTLALSTGPVTVGGKVVGRFNSIWRLESPNTWRIVFDKGESVCAPAP